MNDALKFLAACYCASEWAIAELSDPGLSVHQHINTKRERAETVAKELEDLLNTHGCRIWACGVGPDGTMIPLPNEPLYERGHPYLHSSKPGGIIFFPPGCEGDLSKAFAPGHQGVRIMAGRFETEGSFADLRKEIDECKAYLIQ
ncbi:hypothetical protein [Serratia fonticola]|uniref:hypothetical protein n=1 Tax=Serratia fonticola TaxID=47917 RepID=UPI000FA05FC6|nr:hypothetical protein [Serratia fonticola]MDK2375266.1 hypothetical protein [Serratia fonticola]